MEILCVLALLALITAAISVNITALLPSLGDQSLEERFEKAVREARRAALDTNLTQRFEFDEASGEFRFRPVSEAKPEPPATLSAPRGAPQVRFLKSTAPTARYLIGGQARSLEPTTVVLFHPDGTCTPFTVEIIEGERRREITLDPWTTAEVLKADTGS
jgi:general secretion pathway protein H